MKIAFFILIIILFIPIVSASDLESSTSIREKPCVLDVTPSQITISTLPAGVSSSHINITAESPGNVGLNVTLTKTGEIKDWIIFGQDYLELAPGETRRVDFNATAMVSTSGIYEGKINATSDDGQTILVNITVNVTVDNDADDDGLDDNLDFLIGNVSDINSTIPVKLRVNGSENTSQVFNETLLVSLTDENDTLLVEFNWNFSSRTLVVDWTIDYSASNGTIRVQNLDLTSAGITKTVYINQSDSSYDHVCIADDETTPVSWLTSACSCSGCTKVPCGGSGQCIDLGDTFKVSSLSHSAVRGIYVTEEEEEEGVGAVIGGGGGFSILPKPKVANISIVDYPRQLNLIQGESKLFSVTIENTGELTLKDIQVSLAADFPVKISPSEFGEVRPNRREIFLVELKIPEETEPKDYVLRLKASSQKITTEKTIILTISEKPVEPELELKKEKLKREVDDLTGLNEKIWNQALGAGAEGKDVTQFFEELEGVKGPLALAESYWKKGNYVEAELQLDKSKKLLENAVVFLGKIRYAEVVCPIINISFLSICLIYWFIFIALTAIIMMTAARLRRKPSYEPKINIIRDIRLIKEQMKRMRRRKWV